MFDCSVEVISTTVCVISANGQSVHDPHFCNYTVSHKKRATLFLIITLAFLGRL